MPRPFHGYSNGLGTIAIATSLHGLFEFQKIMSMRILNFCLRPKKGECEFWWLPCIMSTSLRQGGAKREFAEIRRVKLVSLLFTEKLVLGPKGKTKTNKQTIETTLKTYFPYAHCGFSIKNC